jgi:uncharacterized protein (DUF924 family)
MGRVVVPAEILEFWFSPQMEKQWFSSTPTLDRQIRKQYAVLWSRAAVGECDSWKGTADGSLALTIVLDQFPLNMFRGKPDSFSTEQLAVRVALEAVSRQQDRELPKERVAFLYMPLMHSENPTHQELSVELFDKAGLEHNARFARHHRDLILRFGRFPHRNAILGRESTPEELDYLESKEAFKG